MNTLEDQIYSTDYVLDLLLSFKAMVLAGGVFFLGSSTLTTLLVLRSRLKNFMIDLESWKNMPIKSDANPTEVEESKAIGLYLGIDT